MNYLQCRIANVVKSVAPKCDCENQGKEIKDNSATTPPVKVMVHFYLDDYYTITYTNIPVNPFRLLAKKNAWLKVTVHEGIVKDLYRPPRC